MGESKQYVEPLISSSGQLSFISPSLYWLHLYQLLKIKKAWKKKHKLNL